MPQSQTRYLTTVIMGGRLIPGNWSMSGGRVTAESIPDRTPGVPFPAAAGGDKTIEAVTFGTRVNLAQHTDELRTYIANQAGVEDNTSVNRKPLDKNGNPFGKGRTWVGTLTSAPEEETDPNAENELSEWELEMQPSRVA